MRILFIGNANLQNESIVEIIKSEGGYEITHVLPVKVEEQAVEPNPHKYKIALADLNSFSYNPDVSIQLIKSNNISDHIIAIHNYNEQKLIQPILDAGADYYFSVDSNSDRLIEKIRELMAS
jgi:DNA-binding NarL/FixJ family response regulator